MARTLPTQAIFVLHAIAFTAAIALTSDYFRFVAPSLSQLLPASLSSMLLPGTMSDAYPQAR